MHLNFSWKIDPREEYSNSPTIYNKNKQLMPWPSVTKTLWWLSFTFCILGCRLGLSPADITHIQEYLFYNFSEMVLYLLATELTKFIWVFDTDAATRGVLKKKVFSCEFCKFFKNTIFAERLRTTASVDSESNLCRRCYWSWLYPTQWWLMYNVMIHK